MPYYRLASDVFQDYAIYHAPQLPLGISIKGRMIDASSISPLEFKTDNTTECPPDDYPGSEIPVLSERFIEVLRCAGVDNIQTIDALLVNPDTGDRWDKGFKAVNFIGVLDCVDLNQSDADLICPGLYAFRDIAIVKRLAKGLRCFRIAQYPSTIVFDECVVDYIDNEASYLKGMVFYELLEV